MMKVIATPEGVKEIPLTPEEIEEKAIADALAESQTFRRRLKQLRDERAFALVSSAGFAVMNDDKTRARLADCIKAMEISGETAALWKGVDSTRTLTLAEIRALFVAGIARIQNCFEAEESVLATHADRPYDSFEAAQADFLTFIGDKADVGK